MIGLVSARQSVFLFIIVAPAVAYNGFGTSNKRVGRKEVDAGNAQPLSEDGYQEVAKHKNDEEMKSFIRRSLEQMNLEVADEGQLNGFVPHYSGVLAVQGFSRLQDELQTASWARRIPGAAVVPPSQLIAKVPAATAKGTAASLLRGSRGAGGNAAERMTPKAKRPRVVAAAHRQPRGVKGHALRDLLQKNMQKGNVRPRKAGKPQAVAPHSEWVGEFRTQLSSTPSRTRPSGIPRKVQATSIMKFIEGSANGPQESQKPNEQKEEKPKMQEQEEQKQSQKPEEKPELQKQEEQKQWQKPEDKPEEHTEKEEKQEAKPDDKKQDEPANPAEATPDAVPSANTSADSQALKHLLEANQGKLPAVNKVLEKAAGTLNDFTQNTKLMRDRLAAKQAEGRNQLTAEKVKLSKRLVDQKKQNEVARIEVQSLTQNITTMQQMNAQLEQDATQLHQALKIMRNVGQSLFDKTAVAIDFLGDSVNATDDKEMKDLQILTPTTPKPDINYYLKMARSELGLPDDAWATDSKAVKKPSAAAPVEDGMSLLQMDGHLAAAPVESADLVGLLSDSLTKLDEANAKANKMLQSSFQGLADQAQAENDKLLAKQAELRSVIQGMVGRQAGLNAAKSHLQELYTAASTRLNGVALFSAKVSAAMDETIKAAESGETSR